MNLEEALEVKKMSYHGTRDKYDIHDSEPEVLILDPDYNHDSRGRSVLGFNLNYLDKMKTKDKQKFIRKISAADNKNLDLKGVKSWLKARFNKGDYGGKLTKRQKIKRYEDLIKKFPELKKIIRRYKYKGIS